MKITNGNRYYLEIYYNCRVQVVTIRKYVCTWIQGSKVLFNCFHVSKFNAANILNLHHRMLLLLPTNKNFPYFQRTQLHHINQNAIIVHTSDDFRKYITRLSRQYVRRFSSIHHKILNIL